MKKQLIVALIAGAVAFPIAAQAEGAYVGVNVGRSESKVDSESNKETGYKLYGGYSITKNFGAEIGYVHLGKLTQTDGVNSASYDPSALYIAGTAAYPVNDNFNVFAKAGFTRNTTKLSINTDSRTFHKNAVILGVGAEYDFTKNISAVAEYQNFGKVLSENGISVKADMYSLGLRYKF